MPEGQETGGGIDIEGLVKRLARFFGKNAEAARAEITALLAQNPHASKAEIYNTLSQGRGKGKSHASARDDDLGTKKEGGVGMVKGKRKTPTHMSIPRPLIRRKK